MKTLLILVTLFTGCLFEYDDAGQGAHGGRPQALAVLYDISKSARQIPELTPFLVDTMLSMVRRTGGEFAFACIEARKPRLVRLRFEPETGSLPERKRRRELNDRQLSRVRDQVYDSIAERSAEHSRVFDSIELMLTFLSEPHLPANATRRCCIISDFYEDMREEGRRNVISVPENIEVITIGAEPLTVDKVLAGPGKVIPYSNLDGLIYYLSMEDDK
jgi:hypothetical protein